MLVDTTVDIQQASDILENVPKFLNYGSLDNLTIESFDSLQQRSWHMPQEYKDLDIAQHILSLCTTEAELQRCGHELLLFQERNLFDLLRYLKFLVDTMRTHNVIWGVGRGSSVASSSTGRARSACSTKSMRRSTTRTSGASSTC